jgi:hypothetical protein
MKDYEIWMEEKGYLVWDEATDRLVWPVSNVDPDKVFDEYLEEQRKSNDTDSD